MKRQILFTTLGVGMALWLYPSFASAASPDKKAVKAIGFSDELVARHALGRADLAERMGLCFQDQAATLRKLATHLLHAKTKKERETYRASVTAAHKALTDCLDLSHQKCTKTCSPIRLDDLTNGSHVSSPKTKPGTVRSRIIAVDNGSIQDTRTGSGTKAMRAELELGITGKNLPLRNCYRLALKRDPDLAGMAAYRLVFGPDGRVTRAHLLSTTLANLSLARCVLKPLGSLHLSANKIPDKSTAIIRLVFSTNP